MKHLITFIVIAVFALALMAASDVSTVTITNKQETWGHGRTIGFTFTGTDSALITEDNANEIFTGDSRLITVAFATGETSLDSIRWTIYWEGKLSASATTWFKTDTTLCDSALQFTAVYDPDTYGKFPYMRVYLVQSAAQNASQTITGGVILDDAP